MSGAEWSPAALSRLFAALVQDAVECLRGGWSAQDRREALEWLVSPDFDRWVQASPAARALGAERVREEALRLGGVSPQEAAQYLWREVA